jgi:hypothetical protein
MNSRARANALFNEFLTLFCIGYSKQKAEQDPTWVSNIVHMHVLPPTADMSALWTTPFMQKSAKLYHSINSGYIGAETYNGEISDSYLSNCPPIPLPQVHKLLYFRFEIPDTQSIINES